MVTVMCVLLIWSAYEQTKAIEELSKYEYCLLPVFYSYYDYLNLFGFVVVISQKFTFFVDISTIGF